MSEWIDNKPFSRDQVLSPTGGALPPIITTTNTAGGISAPITKELDYLLGDENEVAITDENGEPISLEGLEWSNNYA